MVQATGHKPNSTIGRNSVAVMRAAAYRASKQITEPGVEDSRLAGIDLKRSIDRYTESTKF
jgi:hypothetical protein